MQTIRDFLSAINASPHSVIKHIFAIKNMLLEFVGLFQSYSLVDFIPSCNGYQILWGLYFKRILLLPHLFLLFQP